MAKTKRAVVSARAAEANPSTARKNPAITQLHQQLDHIMENASESIMNLVVGYIAAFNERMDIDLTLSAEQRDAIIRREQREWAARLTKDDAKKLAAVKSARAAGGAQ